MNKLVIIFCSMVNMVGFALAQGDSESWTVKTLPDKVYNSIVESAAVVSSGTYSVVKSSKLDAAIQALKTKSFVVLSEEDADDYSGVKIPNQARSKKKPFLVRGVCSNELGQFFLKISKEGSLIVTYESVGPRKPKFSPLVVYLDAAPENVFVMEAGGN